MAAGVAGSRKGQKPKWKFSMKREVNTRTNSREINWILFFSGQTMWLWRWAAINVLAYVWAVFVCPILYRFFLFSYFSVLWSLLLALALHLLHFPLLLFAAALSPVFPSFPLLYRLCFSLSSAFAISLFLASFKHFHSLNTKLHATLFKSIHKLNDVDICPLLLFVWPLHSKSLHFSLFSSN